MTNYSNPLDRFREVFDRAAVGAPFDPTAVTLATAGASGAPSARIVLLKEFDERGFVFFTNYNSRKSAELAENGRAAIVCYWPWLNEQVRVEGHIEKVSDAESDAYFASRPRESQIAARASLQSSPLASRETLETAFRDIEAAFASQPIPRPENWGGFRIIPDHIEFWRDEKHRMHHRDIYSRHGNTWSQQLLYP
ncbi:MAG: pyridoxamine 5'-phosphate oxidase [Candidatus Sumerlaeaceae bacterium]|nr:pyridoxamine 5'-phosphate oxidase [Candidatus Sumerlaeaceae bacterium]